MTLIFHLTFLFENSEKSRVKNWENLGEIFPQKKFTPHYVTFGLKKSSGALRYFWIPLLLDTPCICCIQLF